jgi:hypothetical protein
VAAMSRIVGDALVAGPETTSGPEVVTVRLTYGQAYVLSELTHDALEDVKNPVDRIYLRQVLETVRAQIGGSR